MRPQTRKQCCGNIFAEANVSPFFGRRKQLQKQKCFSICSETFLLPHQMFPCLRTKETFRETIERFSITFTGNANGKSDHVTMIFPPFFA